MELDQKEELIVFPVRSAYEGLRQKSYNWEQQSDCLTCQQSPVASLEELVASTFSK